MTPKLYLHLKIPAMEIVAVLLSSENCGVELARDLHLPSAGPSRLIDGLEANHWMIPVFKGLEAS